MSTPRWTGSSLNKKQVDTLVITGAGAAADTVKLTIDNIDFITTVGGTTTTSGIATTVQQAYSGNTLTPDTTASCTIPVADGGATLVPQFSEFTATVSGSTVTFTGNGVGALAGKPITMTAAKTGTLTITYTANVTTPTSQYHANEADNYSTNVVPANNDTLVFDNGSVDMRYSLLLGVQLLTINKYKAYSGNVGLPEVNIDLSSSKSYHEYRTPTYLTTNNNSVTTTANLEIGEGSGSGRFKWDAGAGQAIVNVFGQGGRVETGVPTTLFKGSHASNVVNNLAGDLGIAFFGGETATVATLISGDGPNSLAKTVCGSGCTLTTVTLNGGTIETNSAITTANQNNGLSWTHKSGTITTANIYAGTHYPNGGATYTTLNLYGGTFDASRGTSSFVITNTVQMYKGSKFLDPQGRAGNVVFKLNGCSPADVTIQFPANKTYTLS